MTATNEVVVPTTDTKTIAARVREYQKNNPLAMPIAVAKALGVPVMRVYSVNNYDQKKAKRVHVKKKKSSPWQKQLGDVKTQMEAERIYELTKGRQRIHPVTGKILMQGMPMKEEPLFGRKGSPQAAQPDNVNHPAHYKVGGIETIDFIEAKKLGYNLGNVVKYIARSEHKGAQIEDLAKARWYLNREIARLTKRS